MDQAVAIPVVLGSAHGHDDGEQGALAPRLDVRPTFASSLTERPLLITTQTCPILNLTLGPLDLNLLGLMVHLNQVVLNVTAQGGQGNLLGNLLCAVANLLNGPNHGALTNTLNQIVNILNGVLAGL